MSRSETKKVLKYIKTGSVSKLRRFIRKHDVDLNTIRDSENRGLLHLSCYLGDSRLTRYLLRHGVNACATDTHGNTALHTALEYALEYNNESAFIGMVLPLKKKSKRIMHLKNKRGETPEELLEKLRNGLRKNLSLGEEFIEDDDKHCRDRGESRGEMGHCRDGRESRGEMGDCRDVGHDMRGNRGDLEDTDDDLMDKHGCYRDKDEDMKDYKEEPLKDKQRTCRDEQVHWKDKREHWENKREHWKDRERDRKEEEREWLEKLAFETSCEDYYLKEDSPLCDEDQEPYLDWADRIRREYNAKRTSIKTTKQTKQENKEKAYEKLTKKLANEHEEYFEKIRLKSKAARISRERETYEQLCRKVFEDDTAGLLRYCDIPWPCSGSAVDIVEKLNEFGDLKYLKLQRIRWHPDKFLQKCRHRLTENDKEKIVDLVKQISQGINALITSL